MSGTFGQAPNQVHSNSYFISLINGAVISYKSLISFRLNLLEHHHNSSPSCL